MGVESVDVLGVLDIETAESGTISSLGYGIYSFGDASNVTDAPDELKNTNNAIMVLRSKYRTYTASIVFSIDGSIGIFHRRSDIVNWTCLTNFGNTSLSSLATALGGLYPHTLSSGSVKDINEPGFYIAISGVADVPETGEYWSIIAYKSHSTGYFPLYAVNVSGTKSYSGLLRRDSSVTLTWTRIDNFGCNTPEALASLLGVSKNIGRVTVANANDLSKIVGISFFDYGTQTDISNIPEGSVGWGVVVNFCASNQSLQLCTDSSNSLWFRTIDGNNTKAWKKFAIV